MCQMSASEETSCFTSAAVVYRLRGESLFKRFKEMETIGPHADSLASDWLRLYGWEVMDILPEVPTSRRGTFLETP
jgi:hypothetical protein